MARVDLSRRGWKLAATAARPTGRSAAMATEGGMDSRREADPCHRSRPGEKMPEAHQDNGHSLDSVPRAGTSSRATSSSSAPISSRSSASETPASRP
eukprot:2647063-Pyramimonas_sp.AAC.1